MIRRYIRICLISLLALSIFGCSKGEMVETIQSSNDSKKEETKMDYKTIKGTYQDVVGQEAIMEIDVSEDKKSVSVIINWDVDDTETSRWEMTATMQESRLVYKNCQEYLISYSEWGEEIPVMICQSNGYFTYNKENNSFTWNGSTQRKTKTCIFERVSNMTRKEEEELRRKEEEDRQRQEEEDAKKKEKEEDSEDEESEEDSEDEELEDSEDDEEFEENEELDDEYVEYSYDQEEEEVEYME